MSRIVALTVSSVLISPISDLPDNITRTWSKELVSQVIKPYVTEHRITTVQPFCTSFSRVPSVLMRHNFSFTDPDF